MMLYLLFQTHLSYQIRLCTFSLYRSILTRDNIFQNEFIMMCQFDCSGEVSISYLGNK